MEELCLPNFFEGQPKTKFTVMYGDLDYGRDLYES